MIWPKILNYFFPSYVRNSAVEFMLSLKALKVFRSWVASLNKELQFSMCTWNLCLELTSVTFFFLYCFIYVITFKTHNLNFIKLPAHKSSVICSML